MSEKGRTPSPQPAHTGGSRTAPTPQERELTDAERELLAQRDKVLAPYADNLPYNRDRVIEETKFLMRHEVIAKFEIGKRLILLREQEGVPTLGHILEEHFSGLTRTSAYRYMMFSRKVAHLPKLKDFAEGNGNFVKCLELISNYDEDELAALEAGDPVAGVTLDDVDKMSFRELKKAMRKEKYKVGVGQAQLKDMEKENRELEKDLKEAQAIKCPKDEEAQLKILKEAKQSFWLAYTHTRRLKPAELSARMKQEYLTLYAYLVKMASLELAELMRDPMWEEFNFQGYGDFDLGGREFPTGGWEDK